MMSKSHWVCVFSLLISRQLFHGVVLVLVLRHPYVARQAKANKLGFYGCSLFLSKHQLKGFKK